jgi:hypothetical protein
VRATSTSGNGPPLSASAYAQVADPYGYNAATQSPPKARSRLSESPESCPAHPGRRGGLQEQRAEATYPPLRRVPVPMRTEQGPRDVVTEHGSGGRRSRHRESSESSSDGLGHGARVDMVPEERSGGKSGQRRRRRR